MSTNGDGQSSQYTQVTRLETGTDKGSNQNIRNVYKDDYFAFWANDVAIHLGLCGHMRRSNTITRQTEGRVYFDAVLKLNYQGPEVLEEAVHAWVLKIENFAPFVERKIEVGKPRYTGEGQLIGFSVVLTALDVEQYFVRLIEVDKFKKKAAETARRRALGLL